MDRLRQSHRRKHSGRRPAGTDPRLGEQATRACGAARWRAGASLRSKRYGDRWPTNGGWHQPCRTLRQRGFTVVRRRTCQRGPANGPTATRLAAMRLDRTGGELARRVSAWPKPNPGRQHRAAAGSSVGPSRPLGANQWRRDGGGRSPTRGMADREGWPMSAYRKFDPAAALGAIENRGAQAAKPTKPAKAPLPPAVTLAGLATLARLSRQNCALPCTDAAQTGDAAGWQAAYRERAHVLQFKSIYSRQEAERRAWGELQNRWHRLYGAKTPAAMCTGCRKPLAGSGVDDLAGRSNGAHHCRLRVPTGIWRVWRQAANAGLRALGLEPPPGLSKGSLA